MLIWLVGIGVIGWWWWTRLPLPEPVPPASLPAAHDSALAGERPPAEAPGPWALDAGCLLPTRWQTTSGSAEQPALGEWQLTSGGADRLQADPCGNVWGLWFNDWVVFAADNPRRHARVHLPTSQPFASLRHQGIAAFLPAGESLWAFGRDGSLARLGVQGWRVLDRRDRCLSAQLALEAQSLRLLCRSVGSTELLRFDAQAGWQSQLQLPGQRSLADIGSARLLLAGAGEWLELHRGELSSRDDRRLPPEPRWLALGRREWVIGIERGAWWLAADGDAAELSLAGHRVTAVAELPQQGWFAALAQTGLGYRAHGQDQWQIWRHANGLPEREARDLLLDTRGRLWLAGTPVIVIDAAAAARRFAHLPQPPTLAGRLYADGCAAAQAELRGSRSGQVAHSRLGELSVVHFGQQQICPPAEGDSGAGYAYRDSDGAVLAMPGPKRLQACSEACSETQLAALARTWRLRAWYPAERLPYAPLSERSLPRPDPVPLAAPQLASHTIGGELWLADNGDGLHHYDDGRWQSSRLGEIVGTPAKAQALLEDDYGVVWMALQRARGQSAPPQRLWQWRDRSWRPVVLEPPLSEARLVSLLATPGGILVASSAGIWRVEVNGHAQRVDPADARLPPLLQFSEDVARLLWLAHAQHEPGLSIIEGGVVQRLSSRDGLAEDEVMAIAHDQGNRVWLAYGSGQVGVYDRFELLRRARKP